MAPAVTGNKLPLPAEGHGVKKRMKAIATTARSEYWTDREAILRRLQQRSVR